MAENTIILPQVEELLESQGLEKLIVEIDGELKRLGVNLLNINTDEITSDINDLRADINTISNEIVPIERGGTGADDGATGLANLFAAGPTLLSANQYGIEFPEDAAANTMFFKEATGTIADIGQDVAKAVRAKNLLKNSNFANPINSRGAISYAGAVNTIDNWDISSVAWMATLEDGYITISDNPDSDSTATGMFRQTLSIPAHLKGKTVTLAAKVKGTDVRLNINNTGIGLYSTNSDWHIRTATGTLPTDTDTFFVALQSRNAVTYSCEWVALYEGEYTEETLPPYVPDDYALEVVKTNGGAINMVKLWENASPSSNFDAQTIELDLAEYDFVIASANLSVNSEGSFGGYHEIVPVGSSGRFYVIANIPMASTMRLYSRTITPTETGVEFTICYNHRFSESEYTEVSDYVIPTVIYGIKGVQ